MYKLLVSIAFSLLFITDSLSATSLTCGDKSPLYIATGDKYFDADVLPPKSTAIPEFTADQLFNALANRSLKSGTCMHTICKGNGLEAIPTTVPIILEELEVYIRQGEVYINALEVHPQDVDNHHERIAISVQSEHVTAVNENELVEVIRHRRNSNTGSRLEEIRLAIRSANNGITVQRLNYVNSELAEWLLWNLTP